eukprot:gene4720-5507_t
MKLLAYVPILTPRIKYIFNFIFNDVLKTQIGFSSNLAEFKSSGLPKISYADQPVADEIFFKNADLLLSHVIVKTSFKTTAFGDTIVPFAVSGGALPFDVFSAAFYFVSRYEEYLPYTPDSQGHYSPGFSLQNKLKLLQIPVIDGWALLIKNLLLKKYPGLYFEKKKYQFVPLLCMYPAGGKPEGLLRMAESLLSKIPFLSTRLNSTDRKTEEIQSFAVKTQQQHHVQGLFFFKPSLDPDHEGEGQIKLPQSYLQLISAGTGHDYRMAYPHIAGFRAGTCTPFHWYDLQLEKTTHLLIHPVAISDLILKEKRIQPSELPQQWKDIADTVKLLKGHLYILWHQDSLSNTLKGKRARKLYLEMMQHFNGPF